MTKIIMITPSFYPAFHYGGPIYCTYELAKALKINNFDIKVVTTNANGKEKIKIKAGIFHKLENILPVKYYNSIDSRGTSFSMLLSLWKDIKGNKIIYMNSVFSPTTPITGFFNLFFKKKIIISPHGQLNEWCLSQGNQLKKVWLKLFIRPLLKNIIWHATSYQEAEMIKLLYPYSKIWVIPNGIDFSSYENIDIVKNRLNYKKYTLDVNEKSTIIISMGRLHNKKGFDILIKAFSILQVNVKDSLLFIAGEDFGERNKLEKLVEIMKLKDKVFFVGHIEGEEKIEFIKNADIFALPSHDENFGIVYAEALAAGTPIVASKSTPWEDIINKNCGKWVQNTPEKFAEALIEILESDPLQMGINGRKYAIENFNWEKIGAEFKSVIDDIIKKNN